jgi:hypothetical protein
VSDVTAKVFMSCGQRLGTETDASRGLARILKQEYSYEVYVAREQVSFEGVKEAILPQLTRRSIFYSSTFPAIKYRPAFIEAHCSRIRNLP